MSTLGAIFALSQKALRKFESIKALRTECRKGKYVAETVSEVAKGLQGRLGNQRNSQLPDGLPRPVGELKRGVSDIMQVLTVCAEHPAQAIVLSRTYNGKLRAATSRINDALTLICGLQAVAVFGIQRDLRDANEETSNVLKTLADVTASSSDRIAELQATAASQEELIDFLLREGAAADAKDAKRQLQEVQAKEGELREMKEFADGDVLRAVCALSLRDGDTRDDAPAPVPDEFVCGITREVMRDPVVLMTEAGQSYERSALKRWLAINPNKDPATNLAHGHKLQFAPNRSLKGMIDKWLLEHPSAAAAANVAQGPSPARPPPPSPATNRVTHDPRWAPSVAEARQPPPPSPYDSTGASSVLAKLMGDECRLQQQYKRVFANLIPAHQATLDHPHQQSSRTPAAASVVVGESLFRAIEFVADGNDDVALSILGVPATGPEDSVPGLLLAKGTILCKQRKYEAAVPVLRRAVSMDDSNLDAWCVLGDAQLYWKGASQDEKERTYRKAIELGRNDAWARTNYGMFLAAVRGDYAGAERECKEATRLDPNNSKAHNNYGWLLLNVRKDYDGAEREYKEAIRLDPNNSNAHIRYGFLLNNVRKDYDGAEREYKEAIRADPNNSTAHNNYGLLLQNVRKDYDGAEREYKEAIRLDPNNSKAHYNYGMLLHIVRKDYDDAEREYKEAIRLDPNNSLAHAHHNYGSLLFNVRKDYDGAEREYKEAIRADPNNSMAHLNYGMFLAAVRGDYAGAEREYKEAIRVDPSNSKAHLNYGWLLLNVRKDYDGAEREYKGAIRADPNDSNAHRSYGVLLEKVREDYDGAEREYKEAIRADPNNSDAHNNYGVLLEEVREDYGGAEREYKEAIRLDPNNPSAHINYGSFLGNVRQDYDGAEREYKEAIRVDPKNSTAHHYYAVLLETARKDYDGAEREYEEAIRLDPNFCEAEIGLERMQER